MAKTAMHILLLVASLQPAHAAGCLDGRIRYEPRSFLGYACEHDCERHKAGFAWAAQHGVKDATACRVLDPAEAEGCRAWVDDGFAAEEAGYRWALENEVGEPCLCEGAGSRFRAGCLRYLTQPGHAQSWPGRAEAFSRAPAGR